jgi:hypothetical protein
MATFVLSSKLSQIFLPNKPTRRPSHPLQAQAHKDDCNEENSGGEMLLFFP